MNVHYTFHAGTMIEARPDGGHRVYAPWQDGFRCDEYVSGHEWPLGILPKQRPFEYDGSVRVSDRLDSSDNGIVASGRAAVERYFGAVPRRVRLACGSFFGAQYFLLHACRLRPEMIEFLEQEIGTSGPGYVEAVVCLNGVSSSSMSQIADIADHIMYRPRREILGDLMGRHVPAAFVRALGKIECRKLRESSLWRLLDMLEDRETAPYVQRVSRLTGDFLKYASRLPDWLASPGVLEFVAELDLMGEKFEETFPSWLLEAPEKYRKSIRQSLRDSEPEMADLVLLKWNNRLEPPRTFPNPPIAGDERLRPILNSVSLREEGTCMHHCAGDYVNSVLGGAEYFYSWFGEERATVSLLRDEDGLWRFDMCRLRDNARPSKKTKDEILEVLRLQLGDAQLDTFRTHVAGTGYYQARNVKERIATGSVLLLRREVDNPHDSNAVAIHTSCGSKLGYVPRNRNRVLARELDNGEIYDVAVVMAEFEDDDWPEIEVQISLQAYDDRAAA